VVGCGYVGLVTAVCFTHLGHHVRCVEIDSLRLRLLRSGEVPFYEPALPELLRDGLASGRLEFTSDFRHGLAGAEFALICVNTPTASDGSADVTNVLAAADAIATNHQGGPLALLVKSTVPAGLSDVVELRLSNQTERISVASNPEFLRQGSAVRDFLQPDRIVVGAGNAATANAVRDLYAGVDAPVVICSRRSAELAKYAANALLATRVSFMNEVAGLCDASGADIDEVTRIVGSDRRIGSAYLKAGLGWGGSCFPKDVRALQVMASSGGVAVPILDAALDVNMRQRLVAFQRLVSEIEGSPDPTVGIIGLAFKPHTDDLREAPAIEIAGWLLASRVKVRAHDPVAMNAATTLLPGLTCCDDPYAVARNADVLFLATEWPQYLELDWAEIARVLRGRTVFDGRNSLDALMIGAHGLRYASFGRRLPSMDNGAHGDSEPSSGYLAAA
jgi:UDPglucose 6-dehydrogenase